VSIPPVGSATCQRIQPVAGSRAANEPEVTGLAVRRLVRDLEGVGLGEVDTAAAPVTTRPLLLSL